MKAMKVIKISTFLFDLHIKCNAAFFSIEGCIIFGLVMLSIFSSNPGTDRLCLVIGIFNALVLLFLFLTSLHVSVEDEGSINSEPQGKMETTVDRRATAKSEDKSKEKKPKAPGKKSNGPRPISNKVPVPTQSGVKQETTQHASEHTERKEPEQVASESKDVAAPKVEAPVVQKTLEEMTPEDWEELFKME